MNTRRIGWKLLGWAAAAAVLLLVFASYLQPAMVAELANQLWNCF